MEELRLVVTVIVLFMVRIGIPFLLLVTLGTIIDNRQRKEHERIRQEREKRHA